MTGRIVSLLLGYLAGNILTARIVAGKKGVDIDNEGSGNPGMANTGRVMGKKYAALVLIGDILKTALVCTLCYLLFKADGRIIILYAGLGCTIGHCYPIVSRFVGGKGVACSCATIVLYDPLYGMISLAVGLIVFLLKGGLKLSAFAIPLCFTLYQLFMGSLEAFWLSLVLLVVEAIRNLAPNKIDFTKDSKYKKS